MTAKRLVSGAGLYALICSIAVFYSASAAGQNKADQELSAGKVQVRGSQNFRETVDRFLNKDVLKVVGGEVAPIGAYPWQVSLVVSWIADPAQGHFCGGSIYNANWIVTAAHCVTDNNPQDIHVIAGVNLLTRTAARTNVRRIVVHKSYKAATNDNDIALLELFNPLVLSDQIKPVDLLTSQDEPQLLASGHPLTVTGWGATQEGGSPVKNLRFVEIPFVSRDICNLPPSYNGQITNNMICAGRALGGQDACQGDSGGPLITDKSAGSPKLAGIVSWGEGCAQTAKYGVYTRVANYSDWVRRCTSDPKAC
jgi:secreted trypsin-like serine protease